MLNKYASLRPKVLQVVQNKGTEPPFSDSSEDYQRPGTYLCRGCGLALYRGAHRFYSACGWPSFHSEIPKSIERQADPDGHRIEILCQRCHAHLGHVFTGEGFTKENLRHCVNACSMEFVEHPSVDDTEEAILAAGCFWGVQYYLNQLKGVLKTEVGYTGGHTSDPHYYAVCRGETGHVEAIRVIYDPLILSYRSLIQYFFEIHDQSQENRQGPDHGWQYRSMIFYYNEEQKSTAESVINDLKNRGYAVATELSPVSVFWPAEIDHQDYYEKNKKLPYCHRHEKKF